jgi:hypothetical protein
MLKLSTWHNLYLKNGKKIWEDYSFTIDEVQGQLSEKYNKDTHEAFADVPEVARRIVQLQKEDNNYEVEIINGFVYSAEHDNFNNVNAYNSLGNNAIHIRRALSKDELDQLANEIRAVLSGH